MGKGGRAVQGAGISFKGRRKILPRYLHTFMVGFREFLAEAAQRDVRKGVAFQQKSLDDTEHAVFAQRLAQRLHKKPAVGSNYDYGDFLYQSVRSQGDVLGDMKWEDWEITKVVLELGEIDPNTLADPRTTPAQRLAMVAKINWQKVTMPRLKAKLGPSFKVDDDWIRAFGIERLKKIKSTVERGQPITDPHERRLLGIWRTLEIQLGQNILSAGPTKNDVGMSKMPMSAADRKRFYRAMTGTNENTEVPLQLSAQSAYDYLTGYGMEIISDDDAKSLYLDRILKDLQNKTAFIPSFARGSETDRKRWRDSASRSWGGFIHPSSSYDPANSPGFAQWLTGMTTRGFKMRTNPSGRRVPYGYPEPEEVGRSDEMPKIKYSIDVPSSEIADEKINAFYRSGTPEANAAIEKEMVKPARDAVNWLNRNGWNIDPAKMDDYVQQIVIGMLARTGAVENWRKNIGFRRTTASMLARRYATQGWAKERTGQVDALGRATVGIHGGEDQFIGAAKAREVIQRAIASLLDADTFKMGEDEEKFVDSLDSLSNPAKTMDALDVLDQISTQYKMVLPQIRRVVERIKRHLEPLLGKVRAD